MLTKELPPSLENGARPIQEQEEDFSGDKMKYSENTEGNPRAKPGLGSNTVAHPDHKAQLRPACFLTCEMGTRKLSVPSLPAWKRARQTQGHVGYKWLFRGYNVAVA